MRDVPQGQCPDCWPDACYTGCHFHCDEGYDRLQDEHNALVASMSHEVARMRALADHQHGLYMAEAIKVMDLRAIGREVIRCFNDPDHADLAVALSQLSQACFDD